jgi:lysine-specific demethylase 8
VVERITPPPLSQFRRLRRPVVLAGLSDGWRMRGWSFEDLARRHGHRSLPVATTAGGAIDGDARHGIRYTMITLGEYVSRLSGDDHPGLYLTTSLDRFLPELLAELDVPPYCRDARWRRSRLWMSASGTVAPLHRDLAHNLFVQLIGRKRFWLYARDATPRLYSHSFLSALPNFSRYDPERDDPRFPLAATVPREEVVLEPGDVLYIPSLWWHHVRGLERSLSVNFWWAEGLLGLVQRAAETWKRVRGLD